MKENKEYGLFHSLNDLWNAELSCAASCALTALPRMLAKGLGGANRGCVSLEKAACRCSLQGLSSGPLGGRSVTWGG
jgi:hypothetical protein